MVMNSGYDPIIQQAAQRFGVDPNLVRSVIQAESSGQPNATSHKGAGGLMQIMPPTYEELRVKHGLGADRYEPTNNIMAGTAYLAQMQNQFGGNQDHVLGAYNAGPGRMQRVINGQASLPGETNKYITAVKAGLPPQGGNMGILGNNGAAGPQRGLLADEEQILATMNQNQMPGQGGGFTPQQASTINGVIGGFGPQAPMAPQGGMNVNGRIQDLIGQTLNQPAQKPIDPRQYAMQGALQAVSPLGGITNRRVSMGEVLGAAGAGIGQGEIAAQQAQRQQRSDQFGELSNTMQVAKYQQAEATSARQIAAANAYADQIAQINPSLASAVRNNPALMDEIAKAQAQQQFQKAPDPTSQERNALAMGLVKGTPAYNDYIQKASMPSGSVNITNTQEKAESQAYGTELVKEYAGVRAKAEAAQTALQQIQIAQTIPVNTGALEPLKARVGALGEALGFDKATLEQYGLNQASNAQMYTGVMQNIVLAKMQAQTGPQTEGDAQRITATVASLGNTPEASDFLLRAGKATAHRDIQQRTFYEQYKARTGSLDGVGEAWRQDQATKPLVAFNPTTRAPVFMDEFVSSFVKANPGATQADALKVWGEKYANQ